MVEPVDRIEVRQRDGKLVLEPVMAEKWVRWVYSANNRRFIPRLLFHNALFSRIIGLWYDTPFSRGMIAPTISKLGIDPTEFEKPVSEFRSFNDFFTRRLKRGSRPFDISSASLACPGEGRVLVYPYIDSGKIFPVKGRPYSIDELLHEQTPSFRAGAAVVVRLSVADYHRFHYPCSGRILHSYDVPGLYHSVSPIALGRMIDVFPQNRRTCTRIRSPEFGTFYYVEVGAFGVGRIVQKPNPDKKARKMDEKGYFKFGGSTLVLVFEEGRLRFCDDLVKNSHEGFETLVRVGETIATAIQ